MPGKVCTPARQDDAGGQHGREAKLAHLQRGQAQDLLGAVVQVAADLPSLNLDGASIAKGLHLHLLAADLLRDDVTEAQLDLFGNVEGGVQGDGEVRGELVAAHGQDHGVAQAPLLEDGDGGCATADLDQGPRPSPSRPC